MLLYRTYPGLYVKTTIKAIMQIGFLSLFKECFITHSKKTYGTCFGTNSFSSTQLNVFCVKTAINPYMRSGKFHFMYVLDAKLSHLLLSYAVQHFGQLK